MSTPANPLVSKVELANTLRGLRIRAGRTLEEAAAILEVSAATLSRIETSARIPRARDVRELCRYYGLTDETRIAELADLVAEARAEGWWEKYPDVVDDTYANYIALEGAARQIREFGLMMIPALVQTEAYQRVYLDEFGERFFGVTQSRESVSRRIEVLAKRQRILTDPAGPLERYSLVLTETALRGPLGDEIVSRKQLEFLRELSTRPKVELRVIPAERIRYMGPVGPYSVLSLPQEQVADAVYVDLMLGQSLVYDQDVIARHEHIFGTLRTLALEDGPSRELLDRIVKERPRPA